jgi:hypothetical protein
MKTAACGSESREASHPMRIQRIAMACFLGTGCLVTAIRQERQTPRWPSIASAVREGLIATR